MGTCPSFSSCNAALDSGTDGLQAEFVHRAGLAHPWALLGLNAELQAERHICVLTCRRERQLSRAGDSPVLWGASRHLQPTGDSPVPWQGHSPRPSACWALATLP